MEKISDYWVLDTPIRPNQQKVFDWLEENKDKKYLICEAPVGSGKSAIAMTLAQYIAKGDSDTPSSLILTPQKILQQQYETSFNSKSKRLVASLYGKGNYQCHKGTTCDIGSLTKTKCKQCPHTIAKKQAILSSHTVLNYKLAILLMNFADLFLDRKLIIFDECHNIETELTEHDAVFVSSKRNDIYNMSYHHPSSLKDAIDWINNEYIEQLDGVIQSLSEEIEEIRKINNIGTIDAKKIKTLTALQDHILTVEMLLFASKKFNEKELEKRFVLITDSKRESFKIKRLFAAQSFNDTFNRDKNTQFLFLSSTILDYKEFCEDLGLDSSQAAFISLDSEFPIEHRMTKYLPMAKMNVEWNSPSNKKGRDDLVNKIIQLLKKTHKKESGIIHTGNFAIAKWLTEQLSGRIPHTIFQHNPDSGNSRTESINSFQNSNHPGLLISPSITEGLDLIGDLARFAIIAKVGFPYIGDAWIKRRMELSRSWYFRQALTDIIQGSGRVVRSVDDWGVVYILDSSWSYLYNSAGHMIPHWWKVAYTADYAN